MNYNNYFFYLIIFGFIMIAIYEGFIYYKKSISDIVLIKDINVSVSPRRTRTKSENSSRITYSVRFRNIENSKQYFELKGYSNYIKFTGVSETIAQEVFYSYKGEIFSELCFANDRYYNRLEQYKSYNNQVLSVDEIEYTANNTNTKIRKRRNLLMISLFIFMLLMMWMPMFELFL